jgi:RHS repeat-associated protein
MESPRAETTATLTNTATYFYVWDQVGSIRLVTDGTGAVVVEHDYEPYGVEILPNAPTSMPTDALAGTHLQPGFLTSYRLHRRIGPRLLRQARSAILDVVETTIPVASVAFPASSVGQALASAGLSSVSLRSPVRNPGFTGQERDGDTGLDNFHFRSYASTMGRFLSPDNLPGTPLNPQSFNLCAYVHGNPVNYNDPTGHWAGGLQNRDVSDLGGDDVVLSFAEDESGGGKSADPPLPLFGARGPCPPRGGSGAH